MTGENSEKTFDVTPSDYLITYISNNIKNSYVKSEIDKALSATKLEDVQRPTQIVVEEEKEETLCPVCKNKLIFAEGCNICIDCGYTGCTSG
jgi:ribonucleoside-diphosphate reductase alpha chain